MTMTRRELARSRRSSQPPIRVRFALALRVAGRVFLAALIVTVAACAHFREEWKAAPVADGLPSHFLPQATFLLLLIFAVAWPVLLLPVTSYASAFVDGRLLEGATVLGRRRVDLDSARWGRVTLPGRGYSSFVLTLADRRLRVLVIIGSGMWHRGHFETVGDRAFPGSDTRAAAVLRFVYGCTVLISSVVIGLLILGLTLVWLGVVDV